MINDIASIYLARHEAAGNPSDLHVALVYLQRLVADAERGSPLRCSASTNLSRALVARSYSTGHRADLDAAVAAQVAGIEEASADAPERPGYHNNLGLALMARYGLTGDVQDLERATEAFSLALKESVGSVHRPGFLNNAAHAHAERARRAGQSANRVWAIAAAEQAVAEIPHRLPLSAYVLLRARELPVPGVRDGRGAWRLEPRHDPAGGGDRDASARPVSNHVKVPPGLIS